MSISTNDDSEDSQKSSSNSLNDNVKSSTDSLFAAIKEGESRIKHSIFICNCLFNFYKQLASEREEKQLQGRDTRMVLIEKKLPESILKIELLS